MLVSTLSPSRIAQTLAPLPRWQTEAGNVLQSLGSVRVRDAVEAVPSQSVLLGEFPGDGVGGGDARDRAVEGGIESGVDGNIGKSLLDGADGLQVGGVVERGQGGELLDGFEDRIVHEGRFREAIGAVDDATSDGVNPSVPLGVSDDVVDASGWKAGSVQGRLSDKGDLQGGASGIEAEDVHGRSTRTRSV